MRTRHSVMMWSLAAVLLLGMSGAWAAGTPSAKATVAVTPITYIPASTAVEGEWETLLSSVLKTSNQKDLFVDVSFECGLYTQTLVRSKAGVKDTSTAEAIIKVRVLVDGVQAYPGEVVFNSRMQQLSATLQGIITDDALILVDTDGDGIPDSVQIDEEALLPEEIELILSTMSANAFNFVLNDVSVGVHTIEVQAKIDTAADFTAGSASASAAIGKGTVSVEESRLVSGSEIVIE